MTVPLTDNEITALVNNQKNRELEALVALRSEESHAAIQARIRALRTELEEQPGEDPGPVLFN